MIGAPGCRTIGLTVGLVVMASCHSARAPIQTVKTYESVALVSPHSPAGWLTVVPLSDAPLTVGNGVTAHSAATRRLMIQSHETTQEQWTAVMGTNPSYFSDCGPQCPVERVSLWDAFVYLNARSTMEGLTACYALSDCRGGGDGCPETWSHCEARTGCESVRFIGETCDGYRLPTKDEWLMIRDMANTMRTVTSYEDRHCAHNSRGRTRPVEHKGPGIDALVGNVWEWIWEKHKDGSLARGTHMGAGWATSPRACTSMQTSHGQATLRASFIGFRSVRSLPRNQSGAILFPKITWTQPREYPRTAEVDHIFPDLK